MINEFLNSLKTLYNYYSNIISTLLLTELVGADINIRENCKKKPPPVIHTHSPTIIIIHRQEM